MRVVAAYQKAVREQKLAQELRSAKRERDFYLEKVDQVHCTRTHTLHTSIFVFDPKQQNMRVLYPFDRFSLQVFSA